MNVNEKHHRRSIRLKGYDYASAGAYFITVCTHNRECLFGKIDNDKMELNHRGEIIRYEWLRSRDIRSEIMLDEFIVMPNHIHGIVMIAGMNGNGNAVGANGRSPLHTTVRTHMGSKTISSLIAGFKSTVTKQINQIRNTPKFSVWQRNYYDHIIRDEKELDRIREYIMNNPIKWQEDKNNPANLSVGRNNMVNKMPDKVFNL